MLRSASIFNRKLLNVLRQFPIGLFPDLLNTYMHSMADQAHFYPATTYKETFILLKFICFCQYLFIFVSFLAIFNDGKRPKIINCNYKYCTLNKKIKVF